MAKIQKIVVHCSDSPDSRDVTVDEIRRWHTDMPPKGRGWGDIGYQYVLTRDGTIHVGRPHNGDSILAGKEIGAHARGHNADSLSICLVGRKDFAPAQMLSLIYLIQQLRKQHWIPVSQVLGHYELDAGKTCPNIDLNELRKCLT